MGYAMKKIKVQIVDDSALVRQVLQEILEQDAGIQVINAAADPIFAMARMAQNWPDVIVLDVEMPRMDGVTFLKKIMAEHPTPVVICAGLTERGRETTMQTLAAGAVSVVVKPKGAIKQSLNESAVELIHAVKAAACVNVRNLRGVPLPVTAKLSADAVLVPPGLVKVQTTERVVAMGTSTGGTQALEVVLTALPQGSPGIVIVQHMPGEFTGSFAERLNRLSQIEVREACNNDRVIPGRALIAPGGKHMLLKRNGAFYHVEVIDGPPVNRHCPSVDVLFRSVAKSAGKNALGIIMTGMGDDGARGLKEMRDAGALTLGQDEATCVVYGMPREAMKLGAVMRAVSLDAVSGAIMQYSG